MLLFAVKTSPTVIFFLDEYSILQIIGFLIRQRSEANCPYHGRVRDEQRLEHGKWEHYKIGDKSGAPCWQPFILLLDAHGALLATCFHQESRGALCLPIRVSIFSIPILPEWVWKTVKQWETDLLWFTRPHLLWTVSTSLAKYIRNSI